VVIIHTTTTEQQMKYPDYVTTKRGQIVFRFLSNLSDHYNKNTFWIKSQYTLYIKKFKNIPEVYLIHSFQDYLMNELEWLPTVKKVAEYMQSRHDFKCTGTAYPLIRHIVKTVEQTARAKREDFERCIFTAFVKLYKRKPKRTIKGLALVI